MRKEMIWMILLIVVTMVIQGTVIYLQKSLVSQLTDALLKRNFDRFDKLISSKKASLLIAPFNLDYLKLNRYMLAQDDKKITECYDGFNDKRLNNAQAREVYLGAFDYFLSRRDRQRCLFYKEKINSLSSKKDNLEGVKQIVNDSFDIFIDKKTDMLQRLLKQLEELPENRRGATEAMIAKVYENMGDQKKAEEYRRLSDEHMRAYLSK